jgi:cytochrome c-type biogenesis protein
MLLALKWPVFSIEKRFNLLPGHTGGILRAALIGGSFALAWTPCLSPVLGGILMLALNSSTAWQGAYLLAVYSLGLGIPFLVIGLAFSTFSTWLNKVKPYSRYIYIISGLVLIVAGILILTGNL